MSRRQYLHEVVRIGGAIRQSVRPKVQSRKSTAAAIVVAYMHVVVTAAVAVVVVGGGWWWCVCVYVCVCVYARARPLSSKPHESVNPQTQRHNERTTHVMKSWPRFAVYATSSPAVVIFDHINAIFAPKPNRPRACWMPYLDPDSTRASMLGTSVWGIPIPLSRTVIRKYLYGVDGAVCVCVCACVYVCVCVCVCVCACVCACVRARARA
jgi:hypothetical protein